MAEQRPAPKKRGRPNLDSRVERAIDDEAARGATAAQIHQALEQVSKVLGIKNPGLRTIQRRLAPRDPWTLSPDDRDAAIKLETLALIIKETKGAVTSLSTQEANWVALFDGEFRDLSVWVRFRLARLYVLRRTSRQDTREFDAFLGFTPWRSNEKAEEYIEAIINDLIEPLPSLFGKADDPEWNQPGIFDAPLDRPVLEKLVRQLKALAVRKQGTP